MFALISVSSSKVDIAQTKERDEYAESVQMTMKHAIIYFVR